MTEIGLWLRQGHWQVTPGNQGLMKFLADRIQQLEACARERASGMNQEKQGGNPQIPEDPSAIEIQILQAANAVINVEAEWLLHRLKSDIAFVRAELGQSSVEEVGRCAARVVTFMSSSRDFESSEFSSILECADRIFAGMDFQPLRKYSDAFRTLRCKVLDELRQIYHRQNLKFRLEK